MQLILLPLSHHILSNTAADELFNCLYLSGKQTLLRAALVWSIIKYNATWKCIRHETRVSTSHSDFLLVIRFVSPHMLTAAVCACIFILEAFFFSFVHTVMFFFPPLLGYSLRQRVFIYLSEVHPFKGNKIMYVWLWCYCRAVLSIQGITSNTVARLLQFVLFQRRQLIQKALSKLTHRVR